MALQEHAEHAFLLSKLSPGRHPTISCCGAAEGVSYPQILEVVVHDEYEFFTSRMMLIIERQKLEKRQMMKFLSAQTFNSNLRDKHQRWAFFLQDDRRKRMMTRAPWQGMAGGVADSKILAWKSGRLKWDWKLRPLWCMEGTCLKPFLWRGQRCERPKKRQK